MPPDRIQQVAVHGFTWAAAAGWSTFVAIVAAAGGLMRAGLIDALKEWNRSRKEKRDELREDEMADNTRLAAAEKRSAAAEASLVYVSSALSLLIGVVEQLDPNNPVLRQARELVAMAASSDDGFGGALKRLAEVPMPKGVG